ncbi:hypothetical protein ID866_11657 [Astraeus odoratus]|nr:hypothetical protein ID866_11657 [Astraeus odoratus]
MSGAPLRDFHTFKGLCRNGAISQVTLVTTMWDEVEEETGKERLEELRNDYWTDILTGRPTTFRYRNTPESAKELLREVAKTRPVHHIGRTSNMNTEPTIRKDKERIDKAIRNIKKPRLHSSSRFDSIRSKFLFPSRLHYSYFVRTVPI